MTFRMRKTCHHLQATINTILLPFSQHLRPPSCSCVGPRLVLPDTCISQVLLSSAGPHILPVQTKKPECTLHCEDSQLLKHHSCNVVEDGAGKVPRHWIPPLPQKPQTLHIMPAIERKRREERRSQGAARRGRDEKRRK